uniref:Uncharacterized protein n=1 Tax=Anguilla anguilla TaxID=7936 RepID=A0A0E9Q5C4_ANGAN
MTVCSRNAVPGSSSLPLLIQCEQHAHRSLFS